MLDISVIWCLYCESSWKLNSIWEGNSLQMKTAGYLWKAGDNCLSFPKPNIYLLITPHDIGRILWLWNTAVDLTITKSAFTGFLVSNYITWTDLYPRLSVKCPKTNVVLHGNVWKLVEMKGECPYPHVQVSNVWHGYLSQDRIDVTGLWWLGLYLLPILEGCQGPQFHWH